MYACALYSGNLVIFLVFSTLLTPQNLIFCRAQFLGFRRKSTKSEHALGTKKVFLASSR